MTHTLVVREGGELFYSLPLTAYEADILDALAEFSRPAAMLASLVEASGKAGQYRVVLSEDQAWMLAEVVDHDGNPGDRVPAWAEGELPAKLADLMAITQEGDK